MAKLILKMSVTLDGYAASADDSSDWITAGRSEDSGAWVYDILAGASAHLMGATTYGVLEGFWPTAPGPMAEAMNSLPKVVFSDTLTEANWCETEIVSGDLASQVARLKQEREGDLVAIGGARWAQSLVRTGLIDEFRLAVHPVVIGAGISIFTQPMTVTDIAYTQFSGGAAAQVFTARPA